MKKTRPLLVLLIAVIACLLMGSFTAFATRYTSTLDISTNSYHEGATRKYDSGVHNISMTIDHFILVLILVQVWMLQLNQVPVGEKVIHMCLEHCLSLV